MINNIFNKTIKIFSFVIVFVSVFYGENSQFPSTINYKQELTKNKITSDEITKDANRSITLFEVLNYTLLQNSELKSYKIDVKGKDALIYQSKFFENPEIETELENFGADAFSIGIGQLIELGGKRSSRIKMAKLQKSVSVWEYEIKRLNLLIEAGQQFLLTLKSQKKIELLEKTITFSEKSYKIAKDRKIAGVATEIEILQTKLDLEVITLDLGKEKNNYKLQLKILSSFFDTKNYSFNNVSGELKKPKNIPKYNSLISNITQSPDIASWLIQSEILKIIEKEAKTSVVPDLSISTKYGRNNETSENAFILGFSFSLPVWNRNQGNIEEAKINLQKSKYDKKTLERKIYNDLLSTYTEFENVFYELKVLDTKVLPIAKDTYFEAQKFYKIGKISSMELLNYQRELIEFEMQYIDVLSEFYKLKYDLELLIGSEINITEE